MEYITERVGDSYKNWTANTSVFISSQTGTGKTTFVLRTLVPHFEKMNMKILYLVNREALRQQLQHDVDEFLTMNQRKHITIESYQKIEELYQQCCFNNPSIDFYDGYIAGIGEIEEDQKRNNLRDAQWRNIFSLKELREYQKYSCIICDEVHYLLADSNFNTRTILSYDFIRNFFAGKLKVYISATLGDIKQYILNDFSGVPDKEKLEFYYDAKTTWLGINTGLRRTEPAPQPFMVNIDSERKYDYVDIEIVNSIKEITDLIYSSQGKWLVFVDSKDFGIKLKHAIERYEIVEGLAPREKKEVVFLTADYFSEKKEYEEHKKITENQRQTVDVLIATSVLDNGISLKNSDLKNIIIMADNETEFIQMLGRRRKDNSRLNVYLYKYDRSHFVRRLNKLRPKLKLAEKIFNSIEESVRDCYGQSLDFRFYDYVEQKQILWWHKYLMDNLQWEYDNLKYAFTPIGSYWCLNRLSMINLDLLCTAYRDIIRKFDEEGDYAFFDEQLRWLGKEDETIQEITQNVRKNQYERSRDKVIHALAGIVGEQKTKEEFENFKEGISNALEILVKYVGIEHEKYNRHLGTVQKSDRPISKQFMEFLNAECDIPFIVKANRPGYTVEFDKNKNLQDYGLIDNTKESMEK